MNRTMGLGALILLIYFTLLPISHRLSAQFIDEASYLIEKSSDSDSNEHNVQLAYMINVKQFPAQFEKSVELEFKVDSLIKSDNSKEAQILDGIIGLSVKVRFSSDLINLTVNNLSAIKTRLGKDFRVRAGLCEESFYYGMNNFEMWFEKFMHDECLFLIVSTEQFSMNTSFNYLSRCQNSFIEYYVFSSTVESNNEKNRNIEYELESESTSLFSYYDCLVQDRTRAMVKMKQSRLDRESKTFTSKFKGKNTRLQKEGYIKSIEDNENDQIRQMQEMYDRSIQHDFEKRKGKMIKISTEFEPNKLPNRVELIADLLDLPLYLRGGGNINSIEYKYSKL